MDEIDFFGAVLINTLGNVIDNCTADGHKVVWASPENIHGESYVNNSIKEVIETVKHLDKK